jgi:hypothetical protein
VLGGVIVLLELGHATLEVEEAIGVGDLFADELDDALGMLLGRVFALEDGLEVFGNHGGGGAELGAGCCDRSGRDKGSGMEGFVGIEGHGWHGGSGGVGS